MLEPFQALLERYPAGAAASPAAGDGKAAPAAAAADGKDPSGGKIP